MSIRIWISPPVERAPNVWMSLAEQYCRRSVNWFPTGPNGTPASSWVVTMGESDDWSGADADGVMFDPFNNILPLSIDTVNALRTYLHNTRLTDVPASVEARLRGKATQLSIPMDDMSSMTTLAEVLERIVMTLTGSRNASLQGFF